MAVQAQIRYLDEQWRTRDERPRISSRETRRANTRFHPVDIADARPLAAAGELSLDGSAFVLLDGQPRLDDVHDVDTITRHYRPHVQALLCELTGASHALVLHHLTRYENPPTFEQAYARYVHCDYAPSQIEQLSHRLLIDNGVCTADAVQQFDYAWFNSWQPAERAAEVNPLTLIDARSVPASDFREYVFGDSGQYGAASTVFWSAGHRHYYFPNMQPDELLVFRQYDSRSGLAAVCPHTSFDDPGSPPDAPPRRSIEVRMMAVFPRR